MPRQSLAEFVNGYAAYGGEIAVRGRRGYRMQSWTYAELLAGSNRLARELSARSIAKGDAILLWGESSPEWIMAFFACILVGAVAVPLDEISTAELASRVARDVNAKLLLCSRKLPALAPPIPAIHFESFAELTARRDSGRFPSPPLSRDDTLEIIFTSGTTSDPRGVVISHGNVLANIEPFEHQIAKYLRYERFVHPLRFLNVLPLSHVFGQMMGIFIPPLLKGTVVFADSLMPAELIETVRRERVSVLVAVPRVIESLQREVERKVESEGRSERFRRDFSRAEGTHFLRRWWRFRRIHRCLGWKFWAFVSGGAALQDQVETFWNRLGYAVIQGYGMTETTSLISLNHPFRIGRGSLGRVFPGLEVRVADDGEILVRGENVAKAYRRGGELHPLASADGWLHTGDLAEAGPDGRLYFKGRSKSVIVTAAGTKVHPEDLERALRNQEGVRDCVVIGLEQEGNAEPCAVLLLKEGGANAASVIENANRSLAEYQRMRRWFLWPEPDFPRTPTQKPLLPRIQEVVLANLATNEKPQGGNALQDFVARLAGKPFASARLDANLEADLQMSSLDRVELMGTLENRYQVDLSEVKFSEAQTVGQIERLLREPHVAAAEHVYARWPQRWLIKCARLAIYYLLEWPATYLLAAPRVRGAGNLRGLPSPVLVISNHVTYLDIAWILAALPARFRHRLATGMDGERLAALRRPPANMNPFRRFIERLGYFLALGLFNVFPLPRQSGFRKSFAFAGDLVDRGWSILVFPEGQTTQDGRLAPFRSGIGLLATRLNIPVVPMRIDGLFELKQAGLRTARPGQVKVTIGEPVRFSPDRDPDEIARELERRLAEL